MTSNIKVLIADDEVGWYDAMCRQFDQYELTDNLSVTYARSLDEAQEALRQRYFDIAFIDLMLDEKNEQPNGRVLVKEIHQRSPSCIPVLMTSWVKEKFHEIFNLMTAGSGGRTYLLDKADQTVAYGSEYIRKFFGHRIEARWTFKVPDEGIDLLIKKGKRIPGIRSDRAAIVDEVETLVFNVFHEMAAATPLSHQRVNLELSLTHAGMSSSITLGARPNYGLDRGGAEIFGNRCVLKIGPRVGIEGEVQRFNELVKLGVPSDFRVELLGAANGDTLSAVCYSFAGGSVSDSIVSLDELLQDGHYERAEAVIRTLFDPQAKSWYLIAGPQMSLQAYYGNLFRTDFGQRFSSLRAFLRKELAWRFESDRSRIDFEGFSIQVPRESDLGRSPYFKGGSVTTCLVHGDLHGGNVLVDENGRASLIDYATADVGPRFADAAAMLATVRLRSSAHTDDLKTAGAAYKDEVVLFRQRGSGPRPNVGAWYIMAETIQSLILDNFRAAVEPDDALFEELLLTQFYYALSILGLSVWNDWQRLRIIAWLGSLHKVLTDSNR